MVNFNYVITDEIGIHARPAGLLAKEAKAVSSRVIIKANGKEADASKLMAVMGLGVKKGNEITVEVAGDDETEQLQKWKNFLKLIYKVLTGRRKIYKQHFSLLFVPPARGGGMGDFYGNFLWQGYIQGNSHR